MLACRRVPGHLTVGMFWSGCCWGLLNALVRRSAESITAKEHLLKRSMALNSASRLAIITILGLIIAHFPGPLTASWAGILPGAAGGNDGPAGPEEHCTEKPGRNFILPMGCIRSRVERQR